MVKKILTAELSEPYLEPLERLNNFQRRTGVRGRLYLKRASPTFSQFTSKCGSAVQGKTFKFWEKIEMAAVKCSFFLSTVGC